MWGDETPGEMYERDQIGFDWVMEHARNSEAVQEYEAEECIISTLEATEPATLLDSDDWPEGLESVQVEKQPFVGSYWPTVTLRGTRRALTTFILERWGDDDGGTYDNAYLADITPVSQIATENLKEQSGGRIDRPSQRLGRVRSRRDRQPRAGGDSAVEVEDDSRTVLVHLNVSLPNGTTIDRESLDALRRDVADCISLGLDNDYATEDTPMLAAAVAWDVCHAEEV